MLKLCVKFENEQPFITRLYTVYTHSEYITSLIRFDHLQTTNVIGDAFEFLKEASHIQYYYIPKEMHCKYKRWERFREPIKDTYSSLHTTTILL